MQIPRRGELVRLQRRVRTLNICVVRGWHGWCVLLLGLGLVSGAVGQQRTPTETRLDPVVVTATVAPLPLSQTSASVTVMSRDEIVAQQASSVTELLRQIPGVHIDQAGARGGISSVYIRGGDPNFTVVMIDGVKVNDPTNARGGSFDFSTLSPEAIERIEIVRGPLSAVYGSDALSGAINIITRRGEGAARRSVEAAGGRFDYVRTHVHMSEMLDAMDYAVSGSYLDNGDPIAGSEFVQSAFHVNLGVALTDTMELRWVVHYAKSEAKSFPEFSGGPDFAVIRDVEERDIQELTLGMSVAHEPLSWWEYQFRFGLYNRDEDVESPGVAPNLTTGNFVPPSDIDDTFRRYEVEWRHLLRVMSGIRVAVGAQAQFEEGTSRGSQDLTGVGFGVVPVDFNLSRDIWAPFVEVQLSLVPGLRVQGGVRIDFPEDFDREVSPRVNVSYTLAATRTTLRAGWGEGFKLPSFFALSRPDVGNPDLDPETSMSVEAGVSQPLWGEHVTVSATYFYNKFDDLIDFDTVIFRLVNRSDVTTQGVEVALAVRPWSMLGFTSHLTYVETDIEGTDAELRNRPEWRGGFDIRWQPQQAFDVTLRTLVVGKVSDASIPTDERTLDVYARVNFAGTWTLNTTWQLFLAIDNLTDADYEEAVGFPAPGILPRGGVRARF